MEAVLIKLGVQLAVFSTVIGLAAWRLEGVSVRPKRWLPLLSAVLVLLNASLYWLLAPIVALAVPIVGWVLAPFILNAALLWGANRLVRRVKVEGLIRLSLLLAVAHLAMTLGFRLAF